MKSRSCACAKTDAFRPTLSVADTIHVGDPSSNTSPTQLESAAFEGVRRILRQLGSKEQVATFLGNGRPGEVGKDENLRPLWG